ncbi:hypothetical protein EMCG_02845 [[Emmonsia] crescens]|uniref:GAG-pre-integrase domain-containing protein n=1 Tax=[Emmonsia] crescens TaxID=73230 RepID=A0A0G2HX04_9EURO|nr:hypothetical protein EMCG_02845 [Emmonsia crescens UAMH 3008]
MRSLNGAIFSAIHTLKSNIYRIVEEEQGVDPNHKSMAVHYITRLYEHRDPTAFVTVDDHPNQKLINQPENQSDNHPVVKTLVEWHVDLGHIHAGAIIALTKNSLSSIQIKDPKTSFFCDSCVKAGMTQKFSQTAMP